MLGLLALMIAFTFSMALSRFDLRRDALLNEANVIGTTALRARLLPEPHRIETLKLLRDACNFNSTSRGAAPPWSSEWRLSLARMRLENRFGSRQRPWPPRTRD